MYISLSMDPYKYTVITFMRRISNPSETAKLIKKLEIEFAIIAVYVDNLNLVGWKIWKKFESLE